MLTKNPNELEESFELPANEIPKGNQFSSPEASAKHGVGSSNSLLQSPVKVPVKISTQVQKNQREKRFKSGTKISINPGNSGKLGDLD